MSDSDEDTENQFVHEPKNHFLDAFRSLEALYNHRELCDVILRAGHLEIHAHKVVLVACCPYFSAMFRSGMTETQNGVVELKDVDAYALELVIKLIYTGKIILTADNVQNLLSIACLFQLNNLQESCVKFIHHQLTSANCLGIRDFAEIHGCEYLAKAAQNHALAHFGEVSQSEEFLTLSISQIDTLLSCNKLKGEILIL